MDSSRALVASALLVIALAGVQLALNIAGGSSDGAFVTPASELVKHESGPNEIGVDRGEREHRFVTEDMAGWDCARMGNGLCAPGEEAVFPGSSDPRPLKMAGVEIHKKECAKGADARVKLMKRSAIYGHCSSKNTVKEDDGPKEPKGPSTSHGKK